jgi:hypothetical protein
MAAAGRAVTLGVMLPLDPLNPTPGLDQDPPSWEAYQAWHAAFDEADEALEAWRDAPVWDRAAAYAAYRAAADQEDSAAAVWLAS